MGYKTLLFSTPCKLNIKNSQLIFQTESSNETISIPMEDISTIILESLQISVSNYFLSMCADYNITVFTCDKKHQPISVLTPFFQHSRTSKNVLMQIKMGEVLKKRLWQKIVKQKIENQSNVLKICCENDILDIYIDLVQSGDKTNIEGQCAKKYWGLLFENFKRHSETKHNHALDYGYSILRGTLSKYVASSGLIPSLGIHHCNELNSFNLVEDLIEPFRPFVDLMVYEMDIAPEDNGLTKEDRAYFLTILNRQCLYKNEQITVQNACEDVCQSFIKSIEKDDCRIFELPKFIEVK